MCSHAKNEPSACFSDRLGVTTPTERWGGGRGAMGNLLVIWTHIWANLEEISLFSSVASGAISRF